MNAISASLMNLPTDVIFNGIAPHLSVPICGALRQTCKLMNQFPDSNLLELLKKHLPKVEPRFWQTELEAYQKQWVIESNIRKGVCWTKPDGPYIFWGSSNLTPCSTMIGENSTKLVDPKTTQTIDIIPIALHKIACSTVCEKYAISHNFDGSLFIWDRIHRKLRIIENAHETSWPSFCVHEDILFSRDRQEIKIWDLKTAFCLVKLKTSTFLTMDKSLSFYEDKLFLIDSSYPPMWDEIFDFGASNIQILIEIRDKLKNPSRPIAREANRRCKNMSPRIIKEIKKEFNAKKTKENFHLRLSHAINNYINKYYLQA